MVGSSVLRRLKFKGYKNLVTANKESLDLTSQSDVFNFFKKKKVDAVILCAAKVGGILANDTFRGEFLYENLQIQSNVIHASYKSSIKDLIFLGSSCIYPRDCKQPIKEEYLLSGHLEKTNEPYAIAKIAGLKLCENYNYQYKTNYKCLMPCNLYGVGDNYDPMNSHFLPALINKVVMAKKLNQKTITVWGSGKPKRELLYVDDVADASIFFINKKTNHTLINIGSGKDLTIKDYAQFVMKQLDCKLKIVFDKSKPDGTPRKIIDSSIANKYGWKPKINLEKGFKLTYEDFNKRFNLTKTNK